MVDAIDSANSHIGDAFRFRTIDTIVAPGDVTVPKDAIGYGVVTLVSPAGAHGRAGELVVVKRFLECRLQGLASVECIHHDEASSSRYFLRIWQRSLNTW